MRCLMDTMLSFLLERTLELMLKENNINASPERIKEAFNLNESCRISYRRHMLYLKTKWDELPNKILKILHIKPPKNITPFGELKI